MPSSFQDAAQLIREHRNDSIQIISHMDADGVCAAAIISKSLDRLNAKHHVKFVHMLYRDVVQRLEPVDLTIFTDLGSSQSHSWLMRLKPRHDTSTLSMRALRASGTERFW